MEICICLSNQLIFWFLLPISFYALTPESCSSKCPFTSVCSNTCNYCGDLRAFRTTTLAFHNGATLQSLWLKRLREALGDLHMRLYSPFFISHSRALRKPSIPEPIQSYLPKSQIIHFRIKHYSKEIIFILNV